MLRAASSPSAAADGSPDLFLMRHTRAIVSARPPGLAYCQWKVRRDFFRCWIITWGPHISVLHDTVLGFIVTASIGLQGLVDPDVVLMSPDFNPYGLNSDICMCTMFACASLKVYSGLSAPLYSLLCWRSRLSGLKMRFHSNSGEAGFRGTVVNLLWQTSLLLPGVFVITPHRKNTESVATAAKTFLIVHPLQMLTKYWDSMKDPHFKTTECLWLPGTKTWP